MARRAESSKWPANGLPTKRESPCRLLLIIRAPPYTPMVLIAKDVVEKEFLSLPRDTTALEAARQMKAKRHGFAIIASPSASPEGIVTEKDYLYKIVAWRKDHSHVKLIDIFTSDLVS